MSGGVDSSVSAALLKQQGLEVVGVYMKNWSKSLPGFPCPWKEDYQDAKRVAVQLGIEFKMFDFEKQYKHKVVDYMLDEFKAGRTPNPDIMCNQEVKFKLFLETALEDGADMIATGHYAQIKDGKLQMAADVKKDQTYFLYRMPKSALGKVNFPLGGLTKPEVRQLAKKFKLATAEKAESMGICFVGSVGIREFLEQYVEARPGDIKNDKGLVIGRHDGAIFYTIGQRHGLSIGGGLPYYVTGKNMDKNEVYVSTNLRDENLWTDKLTITAPHWLSINPTANIEHLTSISVRTRHQAPLIKIKSLSKVNSGWQIELPEPIRAVSAGQSAVLYSGTECVGGGIVV